MTREVGITVAVTSTRRGWRVKVDASDGDRTTEAEAAGRIIALLAQVAVDMGAVDAERARLRAVVRALRDDEWSGCVSACHGHVIAAVLALLDGEQA